MEVDAFLQNACKPEDNLLGHKMLDGMNSGSHLELSKWSFECFKLHDEKELLDIGCGGGMNVKKMLELLPEATVYGIDYSSASVKRSLEVNHGEVESGRAIIKEADVRALPFDDEMFDAITAFETIYFWDPVEQGLQETYRVLKNGGRFMVSCDANDPKKAEQWTKKIQGMTAYYPEEVKALLVKTGFIDVEVFISGDRMCIIGTKSNN